MFLFKDVNTIISLLPCQVLARFDRALINLPITHIAITSEQYKF